MKLNVAMAQINTVLGNVEQNLEKHLDLIEQARRARADLITFPELSLTGYALQDLTPTVACRPLPDDPVFNPLLVASQDIDIQVGFVEEDERNLFYIATAFLSGGAVRHIHHKVYLPTYGFFDEGRFFARGESVRAFDTRFGRVGMLICEDFWHASSPYMLWLDGADLFLFTSASPGRGITPAPHHTAPGRTESARWVNDIIRAYAGMFTTFVVHTNRAGFEDGINFWGGSSAFSPDGEPLVNGVEHAEALVLAELDLSQLRRTRTRLPLLRDERTSLVQREITRITRNADG